MQGNLPQRQSSATTPRQPKRRFSRNSMEPAFDGLGMSLGNLARLSRARTRSISAENFTGGKGAGGRATKGTGSVPARELGQGWKVSPSITIAGGSTVVLTEVEGPGAIQHIWLTVHPSH